MCGFANSVVLDGVLPNKILKALATSKFTLQWKSQYVFFIISFRYVWTCKTKYIQYYQPDTLIYKLVLD